MSEVPEKFLGSFKLENSENFDEYLTAKGVNWMLRQMMKVAGVTKIFAPSEAGGYVLTNQTTMKTLSWPFKLGESIQAEGFDGKTHKITFRMEGADTLTEEHFRVDNPQDPGELYRYTREGEYLVLNLEHEGVKCKRFLKKLP